VQIDTAPLLQNLQFLIAIRTIVPICPPAGDAIHERESRDQPRDSHSPNQMRHCDVIVRRKHVSGKSVGCTFCVLA